MVLTTSEAFRAFDSQLLLPDRQEKLVLRRQEQVVETLESELSLAQPNSHVIGSWSRDTLIRHLHEADIDLMVILEENDNYRLKRSSGPIRALEVLEAILDDAFPKVRIRYDRNCITMQFPEFRFDIVPAFLHHGGHYTIPDIFQQRWVPTDPVTFAATIGDLNFLMKRTFVPFIRMTKAWNRNVGWPLRSFHLECLMYRFHQKSSGRKPYPFLLASLFNALPHLLSSACHDPIAGDRVDLYLDQDSSKSRAEATAKAGAAAVAATKAYEHLSDDPPIAIGKWRELMGEFFPTYG